ncbi:A/G-specific DNA-adenine glycosylase [Nonlabens dokdonensis]|jgi:A/G-specific adenine glycosylase|uniref:Adenine DNA glycosylase n=1 Tax=Nonlabens dokdonensis TaxID=328515 RepID=A0ABX5Q318_9FLAO|nr:A/G-specific adenine glycosylase [Nonlabens dokdonensis]PZX44339.1 A/G-specific DNA-adenine glycosylase [Nonlabens dokdonensis]
MNFSQQLIDWYTVNKRSLPWRDTKNPYFIWLSEVILQQTRVQQGLPYYKSFVKKFPSVENLAHAPQDEVLKLWQGLGYYSRARNLQTAAMQIVDNNSKFPDNYKDLLQLKGVGEYTAAAIASFAFGESVAVVDGNVYRVLSRIYGIATPINVPAGVKEFKSLAGKLLDQHDPATYNQAIMEFGAIQCVPKSPDCSVCPFQSNCIAYQEQRVKELPVKLKKTKVKNLFHHYLVIQTPSKKTVLHQRDNSSIWAGLFEFPYIEAQGALLPQEIIEEKFFKELVGESRFRESVYNQQPIIHKLSHRKVHAYFWIIELDQELNDTLSIEDARAKPVHVLMERFMKEFWQGK